MGEFEGVSEDVCRGWGVIVSYLISAEVWGKKGRGYVQVFVS